MANYQWATKDPTDVDIRHVVWCSKDNTNDGSASDTGELQGATISTLTVTPPTGITVASSNTNSVTVQGVTYAVNTVANVWLSGGTANTDYDIVVKVVTSDSRTLERTVTLPVRSL